MAQLSISLLGSFQVLWEGRELTSFRSDKERALLAYLVMEAGQPHRREGLLGLLWPDQPEDLARNNLRKSLARLRQAIHDAEADPPFLHITPHSVQFNTHSDYELDVRTFQALLLACQTHPHRHLHTCLPCQECLAQAVHLYRGEFLGQSSLVSGTAFEEWAFLQREVLERQMQGALAALGLYHEHAGQLPQAEHYVRQQLRLDPWDEAAHQHLLRLLAASGQRPRALSHYEAFRRQLRLELGVEPSEETHLLYQSIKADAFPSLKTTTSPSELLLFSAHGTPFIGREEEMGLLCERLLNPIYRLISVVGEGGVGKTRLALAAAAQVARSFLDGGRLISLKPAPHHIAITMAQELGLVLNGPEPPQSKLLAYLRAKEMLLLLDGFEQVIDQASFILELLQRAPNVVLLITSREPLNLQHESVLRLRGLPVPSRTNDPQAASYSSLRLFAERATRAAGHAVLDQTTLPQAIQICHHLQGLPLGIELAAAWSTVLPLSAIARRLQETPDSLVSPLHDVPEPHRSLQTVFEGSWSLLSDQQRLLLAQCSLFQGRFALEAAEAILGATLEEMAALVKKSLVQQPMPRQYALHDVTRYFAAKKWAEVAQANVHQSHSATLERYVAYYLSFVSEREQALHGPQPQQAISDIRRELDNLWLAWKSEFTDNTHLPESLATLRSASRALARFHMINGPYERAEAAFGIGVRGIEGAQSGPTGEKLSLLAHLLAYQSQFLRCQARYAEAVESAHRAIEVATRQQDSAGMALGYLQLGQALRFQGLWSQAEDALEQSLQMARAAHDPSIEGLALIVLGDNLARLGEYKKAICCEEEGLKICQELKDAFLEMGAFITLGIMYTFQGDVGRARIYHEKGIEVARQIGAQRNLVTTLCNMSLMYTHTGEYPSAERCYSEALHLAREMGDSYGEIGTLGNLGNLYRLMGHYENALFYLQQAHQLGAEISNHHQHRVLQDLGVILAELGRVDEAIMLFQQALTDLQLSDRGHMVLAPLSSLALVLLAQGRQDEAKAHLATILHQLQQDTSDVLEKPAEMYLNCYRLLRALGDPQARELLARAHTAVQESANRIPDTPTRRSFLENVAAHREIIKAFAREGGGEATAPP